MSKKNKNSNQYNSYFQSGLKSLSGNRKFYAAKKKLEKKLLLDAGPKAFMAEAGTKSYGFENITGVGISEKLVSNKFSGEPCITVYVVAKAPGHQVMKEALVPKKIDGVATDVIATGEFHAFPHRGRYRPASGGVSVGHYQITAGTLGCLVRRNGNAYILSNNHVLANSNNASIGDPILQPGPYDGGQNPSDRIARLSDFEQVKFGNQVNFMDAAIAETTLSYVQPTNMCIGKINSQPLDCFRFLIVKKCGRTTQFSRGIVSDCDATVRVGYGSAGSAIFQDQIIILSFPSVPFSSPGDSGSLILAEFLNRPVGLLFAGSFTHTIANKIGPVLSRFNVKIVS